MRTYDPMNILQWPVSFESQKILDPKYILSKDQEVHKNDLLEP